MIVVLSGKPIEKLNMSSCQLYKYNQSFFFIQKESSLYYAAQGQRMNQIMKFLTVISSIFIPLTFIVGIYGMNFKYMPELNNPKGYFNVLVVMAILSISLLLYFIRKGWLNREK